MTSHYEHLGYLAILGGTFIEGETILLLAGFAVRRGYLRLSWVLCVAFAGSILGDQFYFFVGRRFGLRLLSRHPRWQSTVAKGKTLIQRHRLPILLSFRFLYGLRIALPVAFGTSTIPARTFLGFNILGAVIWTLVFCGAGYFFGQGLDRIMGRVEGYELLIFAGVALVALVARITLTLWKHRRPEHAAGMSAGRETPESPDLPGD